MSVGSERSNKKGTLAWHYTSQGPNNYREAAPRIELGYTALQAVA